MPDFAPSPTAAAALPADAPHGGQLVAAALRTAGVDTLFTLCGGHILPLLDACPEAGLRVVDHRHEGAAALAAEGYALATGRVGVAAVTAGAGFANALVGLADAGLWSVPLVLCGGHAPLSQAGRGAVQDAPQLAIASAVAKHMLGVYETAKIPRFTAEARVPRPRRATRSGVPRAAPGRARGRAAWPAVGPPVRLPGGDPDARGRGGGPRGGARRARARRAPDPPRRLGRVLVGGRRGDRALRRALEDCRSRRRARRAASCPTRTPGASARSSTRACALLSADVVLVLGSAFNANTCFGSPPLFQADQRVIQVDLAADALGGDRRPDRVVVGDVRRVDGGPRARLAQGGARAATRGSSRRGTLTRFLRGTWDAQIEKHAGARVHAGRRCARSRRSRASVRRRA